MTCREFADFLTDYLAGELSDSTRRVFEDHLRVCVNCRKYLRSYRESVALGKAAFQDPAAPVPANVPEDLVNAILSACRRTAAD